MDVLPETMLPQRVTLILRKSFLSQFGLLIAPRKAWRGRKPRQHPATLPVDGSPAPEASRAEQRVSYGRPR